MDSITFNQDCSSLVVGSKDGYQFYNLNNIVVGQVTRNHQNVTEKDMYIIERLFSSSLIVLVSKEQRTSIRICHYKKGTEICTFRYPREILAVRLNRQRLVVSLANQYYIHNIRDMKVLHILVNVPNNLTGLFALSYSNESALLAHPASENDGRLAVFDAIKMKPLIDINAHNSPLAALSFSYEADMIATASSKGTVIRTFSVATGDKLLEFRRGLKRCVTISSLAFSQDGSFLIASSNTETVHAFKIIPSKDKEVEETTVGWTGYLTSAITSSAASFIPSTVSNVFNAWRAYATARLSEGGKRTTTGVLTIKDTPHIIVVDSDTVLHIFKLDTEKGGECELIHTECLNAEDKNSGVKNIKKIEDNSNSVSSDSLSGCDKMISDASYAYKLKREKKCGPITTSQELDEIIDNVPVLGEQKAMPDLLEKLRLDDSNEFPSMG